MKISPTSAGFFFKGRDYLLNVVRRLIHLRAGIYDSINAADPGFV